MKCPGQDTRYWNGEAIFEAKCPNCGADIEFFKDDSKRRCPSCGKEVPNPRMDFGCAAYCPYAEQCLGQIPEGLKDKKDELFRERLAQWVKRVCGTDFKLVKEISTLVAELEPFAKEKGLDLSIVIPFAHLYPIPEQKYQDAGLEGPDELLLTAGLKEEKRKEVVTILERADKGLNPADLKAFLMEEIGS